jgi:hypothetical protein
VGDEAAWYREVDAAFTSSREAMLSVQNELSRIGRVFRDVWTVQLQAGIAKAQAGSPPADFTNFRKSGRSMPDWMNLGVAVWRVHNLIDHDPPELVYVDASRFSSDVSNISTIWLSGGDPGLDPLASDVYNTCLTLSRLGHIVYLSCQKYDYKIKILVDALPVLSATDPVTGRTKKQWQDCRLAFEDYWKAFFNQKTTQGYGYTQHVIGF